MIRSYTHFCSLQSLPKTADDNKSDMLPRAEALRSTREEKRKAQAEVALLRRCKPRTAFSLGVIPSFYFLTFVLLL